MNSSANASFAPFRTRSSCSSYGAVSQLVPTKPLAMFSNTVPLNRTGSYLGSEFYGSKMKRNDSSFFASPAGDDIPAEQVELWFGSN